MEAEAFTRRSPVMRIKAPRASSGHGFEFTLFVGRDSHSAFGRLLPSPTVSFSRACSRAPSSCCSECCSECSAVSVALARFAATFTKLVRNSI